MDRADADAVAVGVGELDFAGPRLVVHLNVQLGSNRVYVVDIEVGHGVIRGIAGVFGEMEVHFASAQKGIQREARSKTMLTDQFKPYSCIPCCQR
jgi:ABC-type uncharacterized transport system ATPase subunit